MDDSKNITVQVINAFVDSNKGGNPAGVVLNAKNLSKDQKLQIAAKVGLSETAFVSESELADFKLEFFTPTRQIAHCGHATIATFSYLSQLGKINNHNSSKETIEGKREILIEGELAFMEQKAPTYRNAEQYYTIIIESLGLDISDLEADTPILIVSTGNSFAIIHVKNKAVLEKIKPRFEMITQISNKLDLIGYYVFCTPAINVERDADTRMFAPRYGIEEEAGTGMAAGPLACYLYDYLGIKKSRFLIQQGWYMKQPSPSLIIVDVHLEKGKISRIMAGGKGIPMASVSVSI